MEILSSGEKIKKLRQEIGLKQDELTDNQITRSLISMIENGKRSLSDDSAIIIAKKLNHYYKNLGRHISPEYLLETETQQASKYILRQLEHLSSMVNNYLNYDPKYIEDAFSSLMALAMDWELPDECSEILIVRGNLNQRYFKYNESLLDYYNALEYYISVKDHEKIARLYGLIGSCYLKQFHVEQALLYYNRAYTTALEKNISSIDNARKYSLFNIALCYKKMKKYDMALQHIRSLMKLKNIEEDLMDQITLLEASIYCLMNNYEKSLKHYQGLLRKESTLKPNILGLIYNNTAVLYRSIGDIKTALHYNSLAFALKDDMSEKYASNFLLTSAECHRDLNKIDEAIVMLRNAINTSVKYKYHEVMIDAMVILCEICLDCKDFEEAESQLIILKDFVEDNEIYSKYATVYALLSEYYLDIENSVLCKFYIDKIRDISLYF